MRISSKLLATVMILGATAAAADIVVPPPQQPEPVTPALLPNPDPPPVGDVVDTSRQLVVVTTGSWDDVVGRLQRFERDGTAWRPVGDAIEIATGVSGMGWGIGLHGGGAGISEPRKMEGDGRAPAGVFRLTRAFGKHQAPETRLPSAKLATGDVCVDDVGHPAYNQLVPAGTEATPWKSAEKLVRKDWLYDLLVVVDQNHAEGGRVIAGRGSCVFLHVWRRAKSGTAGCTAMEEDHLRRLIAWLDPSAQPLLVQLPRGVYAKVQGAWHLP